MNHFAIHLKITQHCKSTLLQQKLHWKKKTEGRRKKGGIKDESQEAPVGGQMGWERGAEGGASQELNALEKGMARI